MLQVKTLQALFKRYRRPGDIVFAWAFLIFALVLLVQIGTQTQLKPGAKLFAQPRFWPSVSLGGMAIFAALHLLGSALSERIPGRWREVARWFAALEYAGWFVAYVLIVPWLGYLPSTLIFAVLLVVRSGYRHWRALGGAVLVALSVVVLFKSFLHVRLPAGHIYDYLPDGVRQFMMINF